MSVSPFVPYPIAVNLYTLEVGCCDGFNRLVLFSTPLQVRGQPCEPPDVDELHTPDRLCRSTDLPLKKERDLVLGFGAAAVVEKCGGNAFGPAVTWI